MKKYLYIIMAGAVSLAACTTKFEEPAAPQSYEEEEARTLPTTFTVSAVESINLADVTDELVPVAVLGASSLPEDATYGDFTVVLADKVSLSADAKLQVSKANLQEAVTELYGLKPEERTIPAKVKSSIQIEGQGFDIVSNDFDVKVTVVAPKLYEHYYYIGAANNWSTTDKTYELRNASGKDYYEDPVLTVTIPAPVDDKGQRTDNWFKIAPDVCYDSEDFWSAADIIGAAENGESAYEGKFVVGANDEVAKAFNVGAATDDATYFTISINLLEQTYSVKILNFPAHLYMIGDEFGGWNWESDEVVEMVPVVHNVSWGADAEGQFWTVRYFTAEKGFKFNSERKWGGDFWGLATNDGFTESGGNCTVDKDGFYLVHIDLKNSKVHVEPARVYGIGDCFGGWDPKMEAAMFVPDGKTLKATTVKAGEVRMYVESEIATSDWWTREFVFFDGKIAYRGNQVGQGDQNRVTVQKGQTIVLDFNAGTAEVQGEGEAPSFKTEITVAGNYSNCGWSPENDPKLLGKGDGIFMGALSMYGGSFKFVHDGTWTGGTSADGLSFTLTPGAGDNMNIADGEYFWTVDLTNNTANALAITKVGLIGSFNSWGSDLELAFDSTDLTYSGSVTLEADAEFKVRFNANWDYALGGTVDRLSAIGGNIKVAEAGTYSVKLSLNQGTITLTK